jgi:hypothetical protein
MIAGGTKIANLNNPINANYFDQADIWFTINDDSNTAITVYPTQWLTDGNKLESVNEHSVSSFIVNDNKVTHITAMYNFEWIDFEINSSNVQPNTMTLYVGGNTYTSSSAQVHSCELKRCILQYNFTNATVGSTDTIRIAVVQASFYQASNGVIR